MVQESKRFPDRAYAGLNLPFASFDWRMCTGNLALAIPMLLAAVSGVSALVTGIIGIVKSRERSVLVFLATVIGLFVLIFSLGEILFPH